MSQTLRVSDDHDRPLSTGPAAARPYGLVGLIVSLVLILAATLVLTMVAAVAAFVVSGLAFGWGEMVGRLNTLRATIGADQVSLERAGVVVSLVLYAALSIVVLAAARWRAGRNWRDVLGWQPWHPFRGARLFWVVAVATIAYGFGADALVSKFYPPSHDWIVLPAGPVWVACFVFLAIVLAPITEELLFRGWIYTSLRARIGVWSAIIVSSVLFAVAHWERTHLYALIVFPVGLMLGVVREKTRSLLASMTFHALFNGAASAVLLFGQ